MAYKRGERTEQLTVELLRRDGWFASRTRRGPVDVVAGKESRVLLIQVKSGRAKMSDKEMLHLVDWGRAFNADAEVWYFKGRGQMIRRRVFAAMRVFR